MENFKELLAIWEKEEAEEKEKINWLKANKEHLNFDKDFRDVGYAFVEDLIVTDERTEEEVYRARFMGMGEADEFIESIFE